MVDDKLKVMEASQEDTYKGIVRIDAETMHKIGIRTGDILEIEAGGKTVAIVDRAYPADIGQKIIRMDGIIRKNAKTGIGENVTVRKADVKEAKSIVIAPAHKGVMIQANPAVFKRGLLGRAVMKGDQVALGGARRRRKSFQGSQFEDIFEAFERDIGGFGFSSLRLIVAETNPKQPVIITEETEITLNPKAVEIAEEKIIDVTYEDVGGLDEEIKKVREMIEIPLKYPELFDKLGIAPPAGVLLHGPPGSGKTLLAKAVASESDASFILLNGPEIMNKFYGECVAEDSIVFTNGIGLTPIKEAIKNKDAKHIAGLNFETQKTQILPISDKFDKGKQHTLDITTPHGTITLTPTSRLLKLNDLDLEWVFASDINEGDMVAVTNEIPREVKETPNILNFINNGHVLKGNYIKKLLDSIKLTSQEISEKTGVSKKSFQNRKYRNAVPTGILKKLKDHINFGGEGEFLLSGKGKIPSKLSKKLMYVLGLLSGDGHLRYNYKDNHVSTIHFSNSDKEVIKKYKKYIKELFGLEVIKQGKYDYYFSSSAIGNLLHNLGIPVKNKSRTLTMPSYILELDTGLITSYLKGLYNTDGYVHLPKSGRQIIYYTMSKKMANGLRMVLLSLKIQSTMRQKKDGTYEVMISDNKSLNNFRKKIGLTHVERKKRMDSDVVTKYQKPSLDRIPISKVIKNIIAKSKLSRRYLLRNKINLTTRGLSRVQIEKIIEILKKNKISNKIADKLSLLKDNDILWSPVRKIEDSEAHVYDLTVPKDHNFIANGFIVHNSEKKVREIFEQAEKQSPSIIFIDEIDSIAPKREETHGEVERRVVSQLLTMMDGLKSRNKVVVIGATNRPNALDPALRRPGRFDREIIIGVPSRKGRLEVLKIHTRNMPIFNWEFVLEEMRNKPKEGKEDYNKEVLEFIRHILKNKLDRGFKSKNKIQSIIQDYLLKNPDKNKIAKDFDVKEVSALMDKIISDSRIVNLSELADITHGFVGADLAALCQESAMNVLRKITPSLKLREKEPIPQDLLEKMQVTAADFRSALKNVRPSAMREVLVETPRVGWKDIGGLEKIKQELKEAIEWPMKHPEAFRRMGVSPPQGILLYGPPGTGKTLLAKAVAKESEANFIQVKGPSLLNKWVGESEKGVRKIFEKARQTAPTIIFFDELDALAPKRGMHPGGSHVTENIVNTLLAEMDGLEELNDVVIIGATNRPDIIDPALLRPGRFDRLLLTESPDKTSRLAIFKIHTKDMPLAKDVNIDKLVDKTEGYVGSDVEAVCREAAMLALRESIKADQVKKKHFDEALAKVKLSVTKEAMEKYKAVEENYLRNAKAALRDEKDTSYMG